MHYAREAAKLRARRDREIRRLRSENPGMANTAIAAVVGCSRATVYEVLNPGRHEKYRARRRAHWKVYSGAA